MTPPDWLVQIERRLDDATPGSWYKDRNFPEVKSSNANIIAVVHDEKCIPFIAASPDNQRKLISALKVALEALEKVIRVDGHEMLYPRGPSISKEALSEIQKIGEEIK